MLKEKMYVRCPYDPEHPEYPHDFFLGQILEINQIKSMAIITFFDINKVSDYHNDVVPPNNFEFPLSQLLHCQIRLDAHVKYRKKEYIVKAARLEEDGFFYYYISSFGTKALHVCETELITSMNEGYINPIEQLVRYEFQHPSFFIGHANVSRKMQVIENSLYGFKEIAGCKIFLKPYQLKTVMRCLQEKNCRFMIADEVGLGKTIEALSVLKVFLSDRKNARVGIFVPRALIEQWRTELAFKFRLFEGENANHNRIELLSTAELRSRRDESYDFVIVDEVHRLLGKEESYQALLDISRSAKNIIMLSATPIQKRQEEYKKLLTLIQPEKYLDMDDEHFTFLLSTQQKLVRLVYLVLINFNDLTTETKENHNQHTEATEEIYDELRHSLNDVQNLIHDETFGNMIASLSYESDDFDIGTIQDAIAYVCENYQLEKSIIRNRRNLIAEEQNKRELSDLSYDMQTDFNIEEQRTYKLLTQWVTDEKVFQRDKGSVNLLHAFFSSALAFYDQLTSSHIDDIPEDLIQSARKWKETEEKNADNIVDIIDELEYSDDYRSRLTNILDYLGQQTRGKKILLFTDFNKTFELYKKVLCDYFGEECCSFFNASMNQDDLELNTFRFQNDPNCMFMLSDATGGEGRNFQIANAVVHIDLPLHANDIEQRIGRLDRIGREKGMPVLSVVPYARDTVENDIFHIWNDGLNIFQQSQNGLEIIMNEIDDKIFGALSSDLRYGLFGINGDILEMIKGLSETVKLESHYDLAAYRCSSMYSLLDNTIDRFNRDETSLFSESMMNWASLTGFNGQVEGKEIIFTPRLISFKSLHKTLFMPPDIKALIDSNMNQMRNRVRLRSGLTERDFNMNSIIGTFDRTYAIENDYIHFFAPGDEIFDSITENCLTSYKGTSAAFSFPSTIDWTGIIFNWKLKIDENLVYETGVNQKFLNQFRCYLPINELTSAYSLNQSDIPEDTVIRAYRYFIRNFSISMSNQIKHYGSRDDDVKYASRFLQVYSKDKWEDIVREAYDSAETEIKDKISELLGDSLEDLKIELLNRIAAQEAVGSFYQTKEDSIESSAKAVYDVLSKAYPVLDSVCFVKMVKQQ